MCLILMGLPVQVFDLDNAFFGGELLDFGSDFCQAPSSPSDGAQPFLTQSVALSDPLSIIQHA